MVITYNFICLWNLNYATVNDGFIWYPIIPMNTEMIYCSLQAMLVVL